MNVTRATCCFCCCRRQLPGNTPGRNPGSGPHYKLSRLVEHADRPPKCIGVGNWCVRAVPDPKRMCPTGYFRTWVERYNVTDYDIENSHVENSPDAVEGFPPSKEEGGKDFFVPKLLQPLSDSPCTQVVRWARPSSAPDGVVLVARSIARLRYWCSEACPYRLPFHQPRQLRPLEKCTPPAYHRITKGLTTACWNPADRGRQVGGLEESPRPDSWS